MKRVVTLIAVAIFAMLASNASAQSFKFAHINFQELVRSMPQLDSAQKKMKAYADELTSMLQEMNTNYQTKMKDYEEKKATWSEPVRNAKEKELSDLGRSFQEQQSSAEQDYAKEEQKLLEPVMTLARQAVSKIGKDNGFTYIFDVSGGMLMYFNEAQSTDALPLVKKELKITK